MSPHPHGHHHRGQLGQGPAVLDIGGPIGALVLHTPSALEGVEIEVRPTKDPDRPTHTEILRRTVGGQVFWAGVYVALTEGDYRVDWDDPSVPRAFTITGGAVTELDWR